MALYSSVTANEEDRFSETSDEFLTEPTSRCGRECCHRLWTSKKGRCCCLVAGLIGLVVLAAAGTALGLYYTGFFEPKIECDGMSPFSGNGGGKSMSPLTPVKIQFDETYFSCTNDSFADSIYTAPADGLYFFSLSIGTETGKSLSYYIKDEKAEISVASVRRSENKAAVNASDMISKETIVQLKKGDRLQAIKLGFMFEDSADISMTSWSGFRLSSMFEPSLMFGVSRTTSLDNPGVIAFDQVNFNLGGLFNKDSENGSFVATMNGTYFFSLSTGINGNKTQNVSLAVNGRPMFRLARDSSNLNDTDDLSRSHLMPLTVGDEVTVNLEDGSIYSSKDAECSFSGFLYAPKSTPAHAWSVYLNESWTSAMNGSLNPIPMNNVLVNDGKLFSLKTSSVTVNVSGVYFIYASIGLEANGKALAKIRHNNMNVASVARLDRGAFGYQNGVDQLGRGILVEAEQGDTFHLWEDACPGCSILADSVHKQTTFFGFLVYATPEVYT